MSVGSNPATGTRLKPRNTIFPHPVGLWAIPLDLLFRFALTFAAEVSIGNPRMMQVALPVSAVISVFGFPQMALYRVCMPLQAHSQIQTKPMASALLHATGRAHVDVARDDRKKLVRPELALGKIRRPFDHDMPAITAARLVINEVV